jgi:uncharacterized repeat protein (TIGR03803 family)
MNKRISVGLTLANPLRLIIPVVLVVLAGRAFNANAQTETNLHSFVGGTADGSLPYAGLVQGSDGNFYGTTEYGGTSGTGTVFRISPSGSYTNLYSFGRSPTDGELPKAGLVQGRDSNFYGTTGFGGTSGTGTVFRISPSGSYTNLYSFGRSATDGANPRGGLVQGRDSNFYGTTEQGGTRGFGTVFRISPSGNYTSLYSFGSSATDGANPRAKLVQGRDSNFYGTTEYGGTSGTGTVFRISPSGSYTSLYSFGSCATDGKLPRAGLVQGSNGNFYGTTSFGGTYNSGTVFRISPRGGYTNLYSFGRSPNDGVYPYGGLVQGSDGNFYGMTQQGGTRSVGTVFRISPSGSYTNLYSFGRSPTDGKLPKARLVQGNDGNFYGTTQQGGTTGNGTVFKLTVPLSPRPIQ